MEIPSSFSQGSDAVDDYFFGILANRTTLPADILSAEEEFSRC